MERPLARVVLLRRHRGNSTGTANFRPSPPLLASASLEEPDSEARASSRESGGGASPREARLQIRRDGEFAVTNRLYPTRGGGCAGGADVGMHGGGGSDAGEVRVRCWLWVLGPIWALVGLQPCTVSWLWLSVPSSQGCRGAMLRFHRLGLGIMSGFGRTVVGLAWATAGACMRRSCPPCKEVLL